MSGYKGHLTGGILAGGVYAAAISHGSIDSLLAHQGTFLSGWTYVAVLILQSAAFSLWPDVDTNSKGQDIFYALLFTFDLILIINKLTEAAAYIGLLGMLPILGKHRGWTHSWWAAAVVPSPFLILPYLNHPTNPWTGVPYYGAAVAGYMSHLVLDGRARRTFAGHH